MIRNLVLSIVLLLSGAGCASHSVSEVFLPLETMYEKPIGIGSSITTLHNTVWVNDIDDYLKRKPEGSPLYNGDMLHERIHSIRMGGIFGTMWFVAKYVFDDDFMREEEFIGWYFELLYLKTKGIVRSPYYTANFLMGYENLGGPMFDTKEEALQWVLDVYSGKWKPNISEKEWAFYYTDIVKALND